MNELDNADRRTDQEADRLYRFLGQYIIIFQWIESQLDQILLLAHGHENWEKTQTMLASKRNVDKFHAVEAVVMMPRPFGRRAGRPGWTEAFTTLLERLRQEGRRRNGIVHSQYLFEFVEAGMPPLRSNRSKKDGATEFDREALDSARTEAILREIAMLAFEVSQARMQLVHWYAPNELD